MSNQDRLIDLKVSILQLAHEMGNVSKACRKAKIARSSFYEIKKAYEQFGRDGLVPRERRKPRMPNVATPEQEAKILEMTRKNPERSYVRISQDLHLAGDAISPAIVRGVWERKNLLKRMARYLWLDTEAAEGRAIMTEAAIRAVRRLKRLNEASDQHVEANRPGELLSQDLYFVGIIKGVGKIYLQSAVDCSCSVGFARLCLNKLPINSVALVHEKILPFYDTLGVSVASILTDRGREYCGREDTHVYELYLGAQNIEHRKTRPASPYTNGFAERFHQTLKNEFFAKAFREKWYHSLDELQVDLDAWLVEYNERRPHQGYRCQGRTPLQTLKDLLEQPKQEVTEASVSQAA
jgi:transposase InsO family protein